MLAEICVSNFPAARIVILKLQYCIVANRTKRKLLTLHGAMTMIMTHLHRYILNLHFFYVTE